MNPDNLRPIWILCRIGRCGILLLLLITGCSTTNLLSQEHLAGLKPLDVETTTDQLRQDILAQIDPLNQYREAESMELVATDTWNSTVIRWLTPLDNNSQRFRAHLKLYHNGIDFTFLNGDQKGTTIGFDGQSYLYEGNRKTYEKSAAISLYLGPLQSYLEWHQTLIHNPTLKLLGKQELNNHSYWVAYAEYGDTSELEKHDQFLIYINTDTKRVDYIEFTLRKLMNSYRGVIHYKNFKRVRGILIPFWIGIANDLIHPDFDHSFALESIRFQ